MKEKKLVLQCKAKIGTCMYTDNNGAYNSVIHGVEANIAASAIKTIISKGYYIEKQDIEKKHHRTIKELFHIHNIN